MTTRRERDLPSHPGRPYDRFGVSVRVPERNVPELSEEHLGDGTVTTDKLADNSVIEDKINDAAVTTAKLFDGLITAAKINSQVGLIPGGVPVGGVLTSELRKNFFANISNDYELDLDPATGTMVHPNGSEFSFDTSGGGVLGDDTDQTETYYVAYVGQDKTRFTVTSGGDENKEFVATRFHAGVWEYFTNDVWASFIPDEDDCLVAQVTKTQGVTGIDKVFMLNLRPLVEAALSTGSVTTDKILNDAITNLKIAADAVQEAQIAADAVTGTKIQDGSITTPKLVAGAVDTNELAAGAVSTSKLAAGAVDTTQLAADAVVAAKIAVGSITTSKLAAESVVVDKIAANAVGLKQLFVGSFDNLIINPGFEQSASPDHWGTFGGETLGISSTARSGGRALVVTPADDSNTWIGNVLPNDGFHDYGPSVVGGDKIYLEFYARYVATSSNNVRARIRWTDENGGNLGEVLSSALSTTASYQKVSVSGTAPAGAARACLQIRIDNGGSSNQVLVDDVYARRMIEGSIVVDGSITASQIGAGTIIGDVIVASESFTATNPVFQGSVDIEGGEGNSVIRFFSTSGGHMTFHDTDGIQQAVYGYTEVGDQFILESEVDTLFRTASQDVLEWSAAGALTLKGASLTVTPATGGNITLNRDSSGHVLITGLPTSDPGGTGRLWNSGGVLNIT